MTDIKRRRSTLVLLVTAAIALSAGAMLAIYQLRPPDFRLATLPPGPELADFHLLDHDGRPRTLADYRGRVLVVFFGYVHCPDVCPTELFKMAEVMKRIGSASDRVQVLFITLDPERDTPAILKSYVAAFNPQFIGLTGTVAQIDKVAAAFHVVHQKVPVGNDYAIDHSAGTYIFDARGNLRLFGDLGTGIDDFAHDLRIISR